MQHQVSIPDQIERLAEAVIDGIDCADCYEPDGDGFKLSDAARGQIAAANEDLARAVTEAAFALAERDDKITRLERTLKDLTTSGAIRSALFQCGVQAKAASLAVPYLLKTLNIELDDSGVATACGTYGRQTVESAVTTWLASEEGRRFLPRPPSAPGPFASAIKQMRWH